MKTLVKSNKVLTGFIFSLAFLCVLLCSCGTMASIEEGKFPNVVAENATVDAKYKDIAEEMSNFTINEFKDNISKIPRKSGSVDQILAYLYNWGISHNVKTTKDKSGCVYYDVPATQGYESYPSIILQAHADMVQTTADTSIDMNTTPIDIVIDEDTGAMHSRDYKTNIGADDAEGMTALMILATNTKYKHGPLRMLFTYDEETTMQGAIDLSPEVLKPEYLLNIDGGPVGSACTSSAGIIKTEYSKKYAKCNQGANTMLKVSISDFLGGHSGTEIAKDRICANKLFAEMLQRVADEGIDFQLLEISGGNAANVIASKADVSILVDSSKVDQAKQIMNDEFDSQLSKNREEKYGSVSFSESQNKSNEALSVADSKALIDFIIKLPHGCRENNSKFKDKPAVSSNLGMIVLKNGELTITMHSRSNLEGRNEELNDQLQQLCNEYGMTYNILSWYGCWEKSQETSILDLWNKSFDQVCNVKACEYMTHGGLECSRFLEKNPNLKMLSVGMDVAEEHAVTETLYTKSMPAFYASLLYFLENANQL